MSNEFDDDEALFDDIYDDDTSKPETKAEEVAQPAASSEKPVESDKTAESATAPTTTDATTQNSELTPASSSASASAPAAASSSAPLPPPTSLPVQGFPQMMAGGDINSAMAALSAMQQQQQQMQMQQQMQQPSAAPSHEVPPPPGKQYNDTVKANMTPVDGGKMFVGGLNWETTEDKLKSYFSEFGDILDLTIMKDTNTGRSRGFGFLTFASSESVDAVMKKQHIVDGKLIDPKRAIPRDEQDKTGKIFVGGISPDVTEEEFSEFFSRYGTIIDAQLMLDKDTGKSRGYGFVTYDSPEAVDRVTVSKYVDFKGKAVEIKRAEPRGQQLGRNGGRYNNNNNMNNMMQQNNPMMNMNMMQGYGNAGYNPQQMQQYYQSLQQYWMQFQQMGAQQGQQQQQQGAYGMMPQAQSPAQDQSSNSPGQYNNNNNNDDDEDNVPNPQEQSSIPSGPRSSGPLNPNPYPYARNNDRGGRGGRGGGRFRRGGRGGHHGGNGGNGGGYHPYSRN